MNHPSFSRHLAWRALLASGLFVVAVSLFAQSPAAGTIEGRVFNPAAGEYIENARITIEGTALETFTDADGSTG